MTSCSTRRSDGGPPAEPLPNSDDPRSWRDRAARALAQVSPLALIGRQGARQSFWDATAALATAWQVAAGKPGNGAPARAPLRVWCRRRCRRQPQNRTARCPERFAADATHQCSLRSLPPDGGPKKSRKIIVRLLTIGAIYVLASRNKQALLTRCRELLGADPPPPPEKKSTADWLLLLLGIDLLRCPRCGQVLERTELPRQRGPATVLAMPPPEPATRDTS